MLVNGFFMELAKWQERRDSNPQLTVLETVALPIELLSFDEMLLETVKPRVRIWTLGKKLERAKLRFYLITSVIRPAPIVRPPSRIAKR